MRRCPIRSTSYLPDFSFFSSVPGAAREVEDSGFEVRSAALDTSGTAMSEAPTRSTQNRKAVVQRASPVPLVLAMKEFSHVGKVFGLEARASWRTSRRQGSIRGPIRASGVSKDGQSAAGKATYAPQRQAPFSAEIPTRCSSGKL